MFSATIADLIANRNNNSSSSFKVEANETKNERILRQQKEIERMRHEEETRRLSTERWKIINQRSSVAFKLVQCQVIRKDGNNVAKPGMKAMRDNLRNELSQINRRLHVVERMIAKHNGFEKQEKELTDEQLYRLAKEERDNHIVLMIHVERINPMKADDDLREMGLELAYQARPEHGYPAPPFRRGEDYPQGALDNPPKETSLEHITGERDRLTQCIMTLISKEGTTERVVRMINHLERVDRYSQVLCSRNAHVRAKRGTKEYMLHDADAA